MTENKLKSETIQVGMVLKIPANKTNYEEIGRAFDKALADVDKLDSVNKLYQLLGD